MRLKASFKEIDFQRLLVPSCRFNRMKTGNECLCMSLQFSKHIVAFAWFVGMFEGCDFVPHQWFQCRRSCSISSRQALGLFAWLERKSVRVKDFDGVKRVGHSKATRRGTSKLSGQMTWLTDAQLSNWATMEQCQALRPEDQLQTLRFNAVLLCLSCEKQRWVQQSKISLQHLDAPRCQPRLGPVAEIDLQPLRKETGCRNQWNSSLNFSFLSLLATLQWIQNSWIQIGQWCGHQLKTALQETG